MPHSAVLLAGGKSSRMGRDKALLTFREQPLWLHQMDTLSQTAPQEMLISAPADAPYGGSAWRIIPDAETGHGPLAGIVSALQAIQTEWLLVFPVDMPFVTADLLRE
jgi:molybdopterin-guanine dinucleotide biosynthesis protein A